MSAAYTWPADAHDGKERIEDPPPGFSELQRPITYMFNGKSEVVHVPRGMICHNMTRIVEISRAQWNAVVKGGGNRHFNARSVTQMTLSERRNSPLVSARDIVVVSDGQPSTNVRRNNMKRFFWCIRLKFMEPVSNGSFGVGSQFLWPLSAQDAWKLFTRLDTDYEDESDATRAVIDRLQEAFVPESRTDARVLIERLRRDTNDACVMTTLPSVNNRLLVASLDINEKHWCDPTAPAASHLMWIPCTKSQQQLPSPAPPRRHKSSPKDKRAFMQTLSDDLYALVWELLLDEATARPGLAYLRHALSWRAVDTRTRGAVDAWMAARMHTLSVASMRVLRSPDLSHAHALRHHLNQCVGLDAYAVAAAAAAIDRWSRVRVITDAELARTFRCLWTGAIPMQRWLGRAPLQRAEGPSTRATQPNVPRVCMRLWVAQRAKKRMHDEGWVRVRTERTARDDVSGGSGDVAPR